LAAKEEEVRVDHDDHSEEVRVSLWWDSDFVSSWMFLTTIAQASLQKECGDQSV
jgi:hypothetical protein